MLRLFTFSLFFIAAWKLRKALHDRFDEIADGDGFGLDTFTPGVSFPRAGTCGSFGSAPASFSLNTPVHVREVIR